MWKTLKLIDIVNIEIGKTPSRKNPKFWDKNKTGSNIWLSIRDISNNNGLYIDDSSEYISDEGAKLFKEVPKNTLIMSFKLSIGKLAITKKNLRTNEAIAAFKIKDANLVSNKYLYYFLSSINWDRLAGYDIKVKGKTLNKAKLKEILITFPTVEEQQLIVAKLDTAFAEIDKSIQAAEKKVQNINLLYKQFSDIKLDKLKTKDSLLIKDFCYTSDFVANGSFASLAANVKYLDNEDYAILVRLTDYRKNFKSKLKYVSKKSYEFLKHSKLKEGDLILTNVGAYSGTPFLIPKLKKPSTLGPNAILIRADNKIIYNEYLKFFFESNKGKFALDSISTGTTHKKFNKTSLRKLKIKIPSLKEQTEFISKIREFSKEVNNFKMKEELIIKNYLSLKKIMFKNAVNQNKLVA